MNLASNILILDIHRPLRKLFRLVMFSLITTYSICINAQSELTDEENVTSLSWAEGITDNSSATLLTRAMIFQHYQPEQSLNLLYENELDQVSNRIRLSLLIDQCSKTEEFEYCNGKELEESLIIVDSENLSPYLFLFSHFVSEENFDGALESIQRGLSTNETNDYFVEKVMLLREELRNIGLVGNRANLAAGLYSQNSLLSMYIRINPTCVEQSGNSEAWKQACLALGSRLEEGTTFFSNVYGAAIRRDVVSSTSSDADEILAAKQHRDYFDDFRIEARQYLEWWDELAQRPDSYYEDTAIYGEFQAIQKAVERSKASVAR